MEISAMANNRYLVLLEKISDVERVINDAHTSSVKRNRYKTALKLYEAELKSIEKDKHINSSEETSDNDTLNTDD